MAKAKNEYFCVPWGWGYQHGTEIWSVSEEEYKRESALPWRNRIGAYFDSYEAALYYTMD